MAANPYDPPSPIDDPSTNPYRAPSAAIGDFDSPGPALDKLAGGQKLVIYSILLYFCSIFLNVMAGVILPSIQGTPIFSVILGIVVVGVLTSMILGIVGFFRMSDGLEMSLLGKIVVTVLMLSPLSGIILLVMNSRATKKLRAAGYHVGLLGASNPSSR